MFVEPWNYRGISFNEWFYGDYPDKKEYWSDLANNKTVRGYLWRYENYKKGLDNEHIMKSTFGKTSKTSIKEELDWWFDRCLGAKNKIYI